MGNAKKSESPKKLPIQERLEAFAALHPGEQYQIWSEQEAGELLMALSVTIRENEKSIAKPIELAGDSMDKHRRSYNNTQMRMVRQMANKMKRPVGNGTALTFCIAEFSHTPLEYYGIEIVFVQNAEELDAAAAEALKSTLH